MSTTVSGSLSPGAELLTNNQRLVPSGSQSDIGGAKPDGGVKQAGAATPVHASTVVSGSISSPGGDTVELSAEALHMLQQMGDSGGYSASSGHVAHAYGAAAAYESIDYFG